MADFWDIDEGIEDPERFFRLVPRLLPQATHLFVEGATVAGDVQACYSRYAERGPYLPKRQTLWPRARLFRCLARPELFRELADLGAGHAVPELVDHLSIYQGEEMLLEWHDAFANAVVLDGSLPESTVAGLADPFGVRYGRARMGRP